MSDQAALGPTAADSAFKLDRDATVGNRPLQGPEVLLVLVGIALAESAIASSKRLPPPR